MRRTATSRTLLLPLLWWLTAAAEAWVTTQQCRQLLTPLQYRHREPHYDKVTDTAAVVNHLPNPLVSSNNPSLVNRQQLQTISFLFGGVAVVALQPQLLAGLTASLPLYLVNGVQWPSSTQHHHHHHHKTVDTVYRVLEDNPSLPGLSTDNKMIWLTILTLAAAVAEETVFRYGSTLLWETPLLGLFLVQGCLILLDPEEAVETIYFGALYWLSGWSLIVPILAHFCYDFSRLYELHQHTLSQMQYARQGASASIMTTNDKEAIPSFCDPTTFETLQTFFYSFDSEHVGTLSNQDLKRALSFAFPGLRYKGRPGDPRTTLLDFIDLVYEIWRREGAVST